MIVENVRAQTTTPQTMTTTHPRPTPRPTPRLAPPPALSIVIPTYNRRASLLRTLAALAQQTVDPASFEALVVSDGATDGTLDACRALALPYPLRLFEQQNAGPAVARNLGVHEARAPLVLFLDDDVVPDPELIAEHLRLHAEQSGRVVIGPLLPPPDARLLPWVHWEEETLLKQYRALEEGHWPPSPRQFYTGNASVAREAILEAGGFNPAFTRAEDVELAYRLRDRGLGFAFAARARGWHYASRSFASWLRIPGAYGRNDVIMGRDQGHGAILRQLGGEFHERHAWLRALVRLGLSHPRAADALVWLFTALATVVRRVPGAWGYRPASACFSVIFNLRYYEGASDQLGHERFWALVAEHAPQT
jgi:GT2 family glycosyltransferase